MNSMMTFLAMALLIAVANAFSAMPHRAVKTSISMKKETSIFNKAIPATLIPFVAPMASFAAEGTGRAFGIDDGRLIWAALLPSFIIFPLYLKWSKDQEPDDFFDGYEKRRSG
mmetsp:Transcript_20112/g.28828  ORF Transcript_20112/g.28828 Transcript_20112/m.28828 type:complete len:113 (+) Transcript_20112:69-407(+)